MDMITADYRRPVGFDSIGDRWALIVSEAGAKVFTLWTCAKMMILGGDYTADRLTTEAHLSPGLHPREWRK